MGAMARIRTHILFSLVVGLLVSAAISLYADLPHLFQALRLFPWALLPAMLVLTLLNDALRFVQWDYYGVQPFLSPQ